MAIQFELQVGTANAAVMDDPAGELIAMLTTTIKYLEGLTAEDDFDQSVLRDSNGNAVGSWTYRRTSDE